jgi:hypothetical protein
VYPQPTDTITLPGQILGTNRPVDDQGRTAVGRALGTPGDYSSPRRYRGGVIDSTSPAFCYNPVNGRYERYSGSRNSVYINVMLGTLASRPTHRFRHGAATVTLFYPYYVNNAADYGYSVFPSPYYYYSYDPLFIPSDRVIVVDRPVYVNPGYTDDDSDAYYLNKQVDQEVDGTLDDIRKAWSLGDIDLLLRHVRTDEDLPVYLKGKYLYSLPAADYRDLTADAMKNTTTTSFRWLSIDRRSDDEVSARAEHIFTDTDGKKRTVYATFRLMKIHGAWWIGDVGSSTSRDG